MLSAHDLVVELYPIVALVPVRLYSLHIWLSLRTRPCIGWCGVECNSCISRKTRGHGRVFRGTHRSVATISDSLAQSNATSIRFPSKRSKQCLVEFFANWIDKLASSCASIWNNGNFGIEQRPFFTQIMGITTERMKKQNLNSTWLDHKRHLTDVRFQRNNISLSLSSKRNFCLSFIAAATAMVHATIFMFQKCDNFHFDRKQTILFQKQHLVPI